jgi:hypothetical protein
MNYRFFLFSKLFDVIISIEYEYDLMFEDLQILFEEYDTSSYNDSNESEYECIVKFFKHNLEYIKSKIKQ